MTAVVTVRDYGRTTSVVCPPCRLYDPYGRDHRAAATGAKLHNANMHHEELRP